MFNGHYTNKHDQVHDCIYMDWLTCKLLCYRKCWWLPTLPDNREWRPVYPVGLWQVLLRSGENNNLGRSLGDQSLVTCSKSTNHCDARWWACYYCGRGLSWRPSDSCLSQACFWSGGTLQLRRTFKRTIRHIICGSNYITSLYHRLAFSQREHYNSVELLQEPYDLYYAAFYFMLYTSVIKIYDK